MRLLSSYPWFVVLAGAAGLAACWPGTLLGPPRQARGVYEVVFVRGGESTTVRGRALVEDYRGVWQDVGSGFHLTMPFPGRPAVLPPEAGAGGGLALSAAAALPAGTHAVGARDEFVSLDSAPVSATLYPAAGPHWFSRGGTVLVRRAGRKGSTRVAAEFAVLLLTPAGDSVWARGHLSTLR